MKYGKTERISGIVILLALLAIFVPWLMSDPAPREDRPQPSFVIEQPVNVERRDVPAPQRPSTIQEPTVTTTPLSENGDNSLPIQAIPRQPQTDQLASDESSSPAAEAAGSSEPATAPAVTESDPIADLIASNSSDTGNSNSGSASGSSQAASAPASTAQGEWAVQVGSFGEPGNARRLSQQLSDQGFTVYQRERDNNMTTVFVGPYATSEEGESAMSSIKERANVQGLLVRVRD
ncbi:SPOR domain-containing protein [Vreelandella sulfidaeris]|uniref:SPOR domain-containing protein n=1 Tax=Vreelandella sulfidaeris TaxID=115553 RepID=UPI0035E650C1